MAGGKLNSADADRSMTVEVLQDTAALEFTYFGGRRINNLHFSLLNKFEVFTAKIHSCITYRI